MFQHSPTITASVLAQGTLTQGSTIVGTSINQAIDPGGIVLYTYQSSTNASTVPTNNTFSGGGAPQGEITLNGPSPVSFDGTTASSIQWQVKQFPNGAPNSQFIVVQGSSAWPANCWFTAIYIKGASRLIQHYQNNRTVVANTIYQATLDPAANTLISNHRVKSSLSVYVQTNPNGGAAGAGGLNGTGNYLTTPLAGSWTSLQNGSVGTTGLTLLWAAYPLRTPGLEGLLCRWGVNTNAVEMWFRFGGG